MPAEPDAVAVLELAVEPEIEEEEEEEEDHCHCLIVKSLEPVKTLVTPPKAEDARAYTPPACPMARCVVWFVPDSEARLKAVEKAPEEEGGGPPGTAAAAVWPPP